MKMCLQIIRRNDKRAYEVEMLMDVGKPNIRVAAQSKCKD